MKQMWALSLRSRRRRLTLWCCMQGRAGMNSRTKISKSLRDSFDDHCIGLSSAGSTCFAALLSLKEAAPHSEAGHVCYAGYEADYHFPSSTQSVSSSSGLLILKTTILKSSSDWFQRLCSSPGLHMKASPGLATNSSSFMYMSPSPSAM
jgi:hypothetical protein